jgi:hypothetical protein
MSHSAWLAAFVCLSAKLAFGALLVFLSPVKTAWSAAAVPAESPGGLVHFSLATNDVLAFVGGEDVAAQLTTGHLETLLTLRFPGARFRNLGWEGDTVFGQPREVGFPDLPTVLRKAEATVIFLQFGRMEALEGSNKPAAFKRAYGQLLTACLQITPRVVLVTPAPYERSGGLLPDLSASNIVLAAYVQTIHELARERTLPVLDLFAEFGGAKHSGQLLTENGLQLTARGQGSLALVCARQMGLQSNAQRAEEPGPAGAWKNGQLEKLRQQVLAKNKLWFHYYRPQNWAFLGGDRVSQPSSRDHLNPKNRWFPAEMEKFVPLIRGKETEIEHLAQSIR